MFEIVDAIVKIAQEEEAARGYKAQERCGVIVAGDDKKGFKLIELANTSSDPENYFRMDPVEYHTLAEAQQILAIWHTHPNQAAEPTPADRVMIEELGVPWHIVSWPQGHHSYSEPVGYEAPYLDRPFVHGILDCYALIRDWYKREWGIELADFERAEEWWKDKDGPDLYVKNFASQGFVELPEGTKDYQEGDVLLMQVMAPQTNHGAIYVGDGKILHHVFGRRSEMTVYGGFWLKTLTHHLRHESRLQQQ